MEVALMIEAHTGLNWPRWQQVTQAAEDLGFAGLYRSDHYVNVSPPDHDSLELWVSLVWLASNTKRIEFGPLVAPVSFRDPVMMARQALAVDDLSGGRLHYGLGAGWMEREHHIYGYDLLDIPQRMTRFEEALQITTRLLQGDDPVTFAGKYYRLNEATLLPRPQRKGGPPILIGGSGKRKTLPLVAKYADEWNTTTANPAAFSALNTHLNALLANEGREPQTVRRSVMTGLVFGRTDEEVNDKLAGRAVDNLRERGIVVGTASAIADQLGELAEVGVERVMFQWFDLDDMERLEAFATSVLPQIH